MSGTMAGAAIKNENESPSLGYLSKMIPLNNIIKRVTGGNNKAAKKCSSGQKQISLRFLRMGDMGSMSSAATATTMLSDKTAVAKPGLVGGVLARLRSTASNAKGDKTGKLHDLLDVTASSSASYPTRSAKVKAVKNKTSRKSKKTVIAGSVGSASTKSRAIVCPAPGRDAEHEVDELDNEHRERMYADATWRMYDRIMTARANRPEPDPAAVQPSGSGNVAPKPIRAHLAGSDMSDSSEHRRYQEYGGIFALDDC
jgi:hypothetical protein